MTSERKVLILRDKVIRSVKKLLSDVSPPPQHTYSSRLPLTSIILLLSSSCSFSSTPAELNVNFVPMKTPFQPAYAHTNTHRTEALKCTVVPIIPQTSRRSQDFMKIWQTVKAATDSNTHSLMHMCADTHCLHTANSGLS